MKSIIFYATIASPTNTPLGCTRNEAWFLAERNRVAHAHVTVRTEVVAGDVVEALDRAKPREGEIVLNTVAVP